MPRVSKSVKGEIHLNHLISNAYYGMLYYIQKEKGTQTAVRGRKTVRIQITTC